MDKTTTWLIRGAALTVMLVGFFNYLQPEMRRQSEIKSNLDSSYERYSVKERCENFPIISEAEFRNFYQDGLIKETLFSSENLPMQINTSKGNFLTDLYPTQDLLQMLVDKNIPRRMADKKMCK